MLLGLVINDGDRSFFGDFLPKSIGNAGVRMIEYKDLDDIPFVFKNLRETIDAYLFVNEEAYYAALPSIEDGVICSLARPKRSNLGEALLRAYRKGYDITLASFDMFSAADIEYSYWSCSIPRSREIITCYFERLGNDKSLSIADFHTGPYRDGKTMLCMTSLRSVYEILQRRGIPCERVYPDPQTISDMLAMLAVGVSRKKQDRNEIAIVRIIIGSTVDDHDTIGRNSFVEIKNRNLISEEIGAFSYEIGAALFQMSEVRYEMVVNRDSLESATNVYQSIPILSIGEKGIPNHVSIGIGYGSNMADAKKNAAVACDKAKKYLENAAYVIDGDKDSGPIYHAGKVGYDGNISSRGAIENLSRISGVSTDTLLKMQVAVEARKTDSFTPHELAQICGCSSRNMDRILIKMEFCGLVETVGTTSSRAGRPARIIKLKLLPNETAEI